MRTFEIKPAKRGKSNVLVAIVGYSDTGKTESALRLATGFGGKIVVIDTEHGRSTIKADRYKFDILELEAPHGPLEYLAAGQAAEKAGAATIIIDSMSHEHEGQGGLLELHKAAADRLKAKWSTTYEKAQMSAWNEPEVKPARKQLLYWMTHSDCNFILCFRAREKMDLTNAAKPKKLGYMPVGGEEYFYEMTTRFLLFPEPKGVPQWQPEEEGEKAIIRKPDNAELAKIVNGQINEKMGAAMVAWASGETAAPPPTIEYATKEQADEIVVEMKRLKFDRATAKEWLAQYGATKVTDIPLDRAIPALQELMKRKGPDDES